MDLGENVLLARLKKEYPLEDYTLIELHTEFERLTGIFFKYGLIELVLYVQANRLGLIEIVIYHNHFVLCNFHRGN